MGYESPNLIQFHSTSDTGEITGMISLPFNMEQLHNISQVFLGKISIQDDSLLIQNRQIEFRLTESGYFSLKSNTIKKNIDKFFNHILTAIIKTETCANCGVCADICPQKIISIEKYGEKYIPVIQSSTESPCIHCLKCLTHCPLYSVVKGHT